jgi:type II secretory pathway pseudopilin PulG
MGRLIKKKLRAATLIETLIAMLIILLVLGVSIMVYVNIMKSDQHFKNLKADLSMEEVAAQTSERQNYHTKTIMKGERRVKRTIANFESASNVKHLQLTAFDNQNNKVKQYHELVVVEP